MHSGKRIRLRIPEDEQNDRLSTKLISGKLIHTQSKLIFPAQNSSSSFAATEYEAHLNTKKSLVIMFLKQSQWLNLTLSTLFVKSKELNC